MQRTGGLAIQVRQVSPGNSPQAVQVEVCVAQLEWIKGPLNQPNAAGQGVLALKELEHAADAPVAVGGIDAGHMGVQVGCAFAKADNREGVADQPLDRKS